MVANNTPDPLRAVLARPDINDAQRGQLLLTLFALLIRLNVQPRAVDEFLTVLRKFHREAAKREDAMRTRTPDSE